MSENNIDERVVTKLPDGSNLITKPMEEVMHNSMMPYAEYVILDRALPRVEDGLKPVQRRILYTMYELGMAPDKPYRKSARIVGDCLGKYHPHGDTSVYDAMVRMAQSFNMRMPLVDGQGNFGSVDGDSAAAMRYTEAKLAPLALELLKDIDKNTVKWSRNFDDHLKEPDMLPGRYPNLLVNGASGIAVGLATNIPPHNLGEVIDGVIAYLDNKNISLKNMMKIIKGPDFPTGGFVSGSEEIEQAYISGKAKLTMRGRVHIEVLANDKKNIVITELPYQVNKADLLKKILALREDKKELLSGISEIVDESDKEGMRAVVRVKKDFDPKEILKLIYKHTDLQTTFGVNMVAIADGRPKLMGLMEIISFYANYQLEVILRRTKFDLEAAKEREHILLGLVIAVKNIDEVIAIIKKSGSVSEAKAALKERFALSEKQAQAILDLRLARLTKLEITRLEEELAELETLIANLNAILASKKLQSEVVKTELNQIKRMYKSPRRSEIYAKIDDSPIPSESDEKPIETFVIGITANDSLKRIPIKNFSMSSKEFTDKATLNEVYKTLIETETGATLMCFSNLGNAFKMDASAVVEARFRDKGETIKKTITMLADNENIVATYAVFDTIPKTDLLFYTKSGMVKRTSFTEYDLAKNNFVAMKLKEDDEIINIETAVDDTSILFITKNGMTLNFDKNDIPVQGRISGGVKGMLLSEDDEVAFAAQIYGEGEVIIATDKGFFKRVILADIDIMARYRKGIKIIELKGDNGAFVKYCNIVTIPYEIAIVCDDEIFALSSEDISIESRTGKGKAPKAKKKGFKLNSAYRIKIAPDYVIKQKG